MNKKKNNKQWIEPLEGNDDFETVVNKILGSYVPEEKKEPEGK